MGVRTHTHGASGYIREPRLWTESSLALRHVFSQLVICTETPIGLPDRRNIYECSKDRRPKSGLVGNSTTFFGNWFPFWLCR